MSFTPRLVALDVDGTIVDGDNTFTPAVREAVIAVRAAGVPVVISTGRSVPGVVEVAERLGVADGLAVASNGAVVFAYDPFDVVHTMTFDASEAVTRVLRHVPEAYIAVEEVGVGYRVNREFPASEIQGRFRVETVDSLVAEPVSRVIVRAPEHDHREFAALVEGLGLTDTNYYIGYTSWLDLAPAGVSKASGLQLLCDRMGIARADVLAVGDGNNDVEMLRWAGRGVAMGHAPPDVLAAADDVTGTVADDGLATELHRWL